MNKLYNMYLLDLESTVDSLYNAFYEERNEIYVLEGGCTNSYELSVDMAYQNLIDQLMPLFQEAVNRGCVMEDLEKIFPDEITGLI